MKLWPYKILGRDDDDIKTNLEQIIGHFSRKGIVFDTVVFIPNAGIYLSELFIELFGERYDINFITVRRSSTVAKSNFIKELIFSKKRLSDFMRHLEVLLRLVKYRLGIKQKMTAKLKIDFNVIDKKILVIDDSVDTGTTLKMVKSALMEKRVQSVSTACISNHLVPDKVDVDYSVYRYSLLRTKNSRDYYAT